MELKVESLVTRKLIGKGQLGFSLDMVILEARNGNYEPENTFRAEIESLAEAEKASINVAFMQ